MFQAPFRPDDNVQTANSRSTAVFDQSGLYRMFLRRSFTSKVFRGPRPNRMVFIMLNPSTADASNNDPTITRCMNFAQREGAETLDVVNLFAYRSTDPRALFSVADPIHPANNDWIKWTASGAEKVVCAWGAHGLSKRRGAEVLEMIKPISDPLCLELSRLGFPRHPLYIKNDCPLRPYLGDGV